MPTGREHPAASVALCRGCGSVALAERDRCTICGGAFGPTSPVAAFEPERRWARLECHFRCASCGVSSALDELGSSGRVSCAHCGFEQSLDARVWPRVLATSHDVADLASSDPSVRSSTDLQRDNPYRIIGLSVSEWSWTEPAAVAGREPLTLRASPGHPLCERCHAPKVADLRSDGLSLACSRCGAREMHARLATPFHPTLVASASVASRTDIPAARSVLGSDGVARVSCPHCGAPLPADQNVTSIICSHCHAPSLISAKLWHRLGRREPRPEPIWLLFSGRSARRRELEDRTAGVDPFERELQARARAVLAAQNFPGPTPPPDPSPPAKLPPAMVPPGMALPPLNSPPGTSRAGTKAAGIAIGLLIALVVLATVAGAVGYFLL